MPDHCGHETVKVEGCPYTEEGEAFDIDVLLAEWRKLDERRRAA